MASPPVPVDTRTLPTQKAQNPARMRPASYLWILAPAVLVYIGFIIFPFIEGVRYSFFNWTGMGPATDFVGLGNYQFVLSPSGFFPVLGRALLHNLYFFVLSFFMSVILGLFLAFLLYTSNERVSRFFQALFFIPYVIPPIVVGYMFSIYLEPGFGLLGTLATQLNMPFLGTPVLGDPGYALPTVVAISSWAGMGFPVLVFLAALIGIPHEVLDAAKVDGASSFRSFVHVIFPMLRSTFVTVVTLSWIASFAVFDIVYVLEGTQAGPNYATDILGTLFYRTAWGGFGATATGLGLAATVAVVGFIFVMAIATGFVWAQRRFAVEV